MNDLVPIWKLEDVQRHLQDAVDLELWTIPFYLAAMYSIRERSNPSFQLLQSVAYQEMLHLSLAANVANAYGAEVVIRPPVYVGQNIPHLEFALDKPNPTDEFKPYSAEIGPLDVQRANAMCLIEYPRWASKEKPDLRPKTEEYGSIGEFYRALSLGMAERARDVRGGRNQVGLFARFYANMDRVTVDGDGAAGHAEARRLMQAITTQGEGDTRGERDIATTFWNTADDNDASTAHFGKFKKVLAAVTGKHPPATYHGVAHPPPGSPGAKAQEILIRDFAVLCKEMEGLFRGANPADFGPRMSKVGAAIVSCWQHEAIPRFSPESPR